MFKEVHTLTVQKIEYSSAYSISFGLQTDYLDRNGVEGAKKH